jgi:hypothetical protein
MLRPEYRGKPALAAIRQNINYMPIRRIHRRRVAHHPHPLARKLPRKIRDNFVKP